jgi:hypothetical protein
MYQERKHHHTFKESVELSLYLRVIGISCTYRSPCQGHKCFAAAAIVVATAHAVVVENTIITLQRRRSVHLHVWLQHLIVVAIK